jgi:thioredoxin reductase
MRRDDARRAKELLAHMHQMNTKADAERRNFTPQETVQFEEIAAEVRSITDGAPLGALPSSDNNGQAMKLRVDACRYEVAAVHGDGRLEAVELRDRRDRRVVGVDVSAVFVMIGAEPCTEAVAGMLDVDAAGY